MYLKRKIYSQLLEWKNDTGHSTLEVTGARQVGKTYIINKFADENFRHKIYINLFEQSGQQFMQCYKQATAWEPGTKRPEHPLHDVFRLFDVEFEDTEDTVIIIDEIQESSEVYNRIREFTRQFQARFIVTGSYLGKIYDPEFRYSSGDVTSLPIYTLSFEEFLQAYNEELYNEYLMLSPVMPQEDQTHQQLTEAYEIYTHIGGYPKVVETYLETGDFQKAQGVLVKIIDTFTNESIRYFSDILDTRVFTQIFFSIIGFCAKITEMDILEFKPASRCFFMDPGLANYYLALTGTDSRTLAGTLNENYVYINLKRRQDFPPEIAFETPAFATYKGGEIDFVAQSIHSHIRYLVEVKSGKGTATTAQKALDQGKADRLLYLKGDTKGGRAGKIDTVPLYMLERYSFDESSV